MQFYKNKLIYITIALFILPLVMPVYSHAVKDTSYVWSELSSDILETSQVLCEAQR